MHVSECASFINHQSQLIDRLRVQEPVQRQLDAAAVGSPHHHSDSGSAAADGFASSSSLSAGGDTDERGHLSPDAIKTGTAAAAGAATADASTGTDAAASSGDHSAPTSGSSPGASSTQAQPAPAVRTLPPPLAWEVRKTSTSSHVPDRTSENGTV
jgi:hypothetical protein